VKALSLTQPMAWAIFHGKDVENRRWSTKFRGRVYIHASKGFDKEHHGHKQGEVKLVACARCTYEEYKTKTLAKEV